MFSKILVSYDGSEHASNALRMACGLAMKFDAELHLAHVPQVDTPAVFIGAYADAMPIMPTEEEIAEAGTRIIAQSDEQAEKAGAKITRHHVGRGLPARHTLKVAEEIGADLIVMGRRGLGALSALALGSVSQSITHGAKCPCLTVI